MTVGTLVAYQIGEAHYDLAVASTMLLTTLSLFHLVAGLLARDQVHTIFNRARACRVPRSCAGTALRSLAIILVTEIGFLQRVFSTVAHLQPVVDLHRDRVLARGGRGDHQGLHPAPRPRRLGRCRAPAKAALAPAGR